MLKKLIFHSILLAALPMLLTAQNKEVWSLEDCIRYAMENNITIKQAELNTQYSENTYSQSKMSRLPNLNASGDYRYAFGRVLDQTAYEFKNEDQNYVGVNLSSSVNLFNGFQKTNTIQRNYLNLMASYEDVNKIRNDISLNIAAAYLQILFNSELVDVARNQMEITGQQVERTQKLVDAGKVARGNFLEIQAQYASEELNLVNAENQLQMSYLNLQQLLDLPYDPQFSIVTPDLPAPGDSLVSMNAKEVFETATEIMPQITSAEYALESAKKDLSIAKGMRSPSLTLSGNTRTDYSDLAPYPDPLEIGRKYTFAEQMSDNISVGIGLGLSIPIFNGNQVNTSISNARIGIENAQLELQNRKNELFRQIQQSYVDAIAALKKYESTQQALAAMEESFRYMERKYEVGLINTVEYNTSKNQLTITQSDLLQAKYDFIFKTKILNFYKGEPIVL